MSRLNPGQLDSLPADAQGCVVMDIRSVRIWSHNMADSLANLIRNCL